MKLYLAGPMRRYPEFNFPTFFSWGDTLVGMGHYVHNPALEDDMAGYRWKGATGQEDIRELWPDGQERDLRDVLAEDIAWILDHADGVAVLPGWEESKGARAEVSAALAAGIPVAPVEAFGPGGIIGPERNLIRSVPCVDKLGRRGLLDMPLEHFVPAALKDDFEDFVTTPPPMSVNARRRALGLPALDDEVRVTSETGGEKGQKLAQLGSLDPQSLLIVAKVSGFGAQKYARYNYLKGYDWSLSFDALQRHLLAFWAGEDIDPESGLPHLGHAAWHCLALLSFSTRGLGTDDRYRQEDVA